MPPGHDPLCFAPMTGGSVVTIGNFDGVHLGHQALLARCRELTRGTARAAVAVTFEPSPAVILRPGSEPPRLMSPETKRTRLLRHADAVVTLEPTREMLAQSPEAFVRWLVDEHRIAAIVEGPDFHFGKNRAGTLDVLHDLGAKHGFAVHIIERTRIELADQSLAPVTSSLIRWLIGRGRVADAARCLGELFSLTGRVVRGEQQGRTLGIPTANLDPAGYEGFIIPADGVYAGVALIPGHPPLAAAISIGTKPTFGVKQLTVEAHLLDYHPEPFEALYGQTITLAFHRWLRDQWAFPDLPSLRAQLDRDLAETRAVSAACPENGAPAP